MSAAHDLLHDYQHIIVDLNLIMGSKGVFDVIVDGKVLYSKGVNGRHANPGEVLELFRKQYGQNVDAYER